jgi:hypothetical protein
VQGRKCAYKKQGGVQVSDILGNQVVVVFVTDFLVDGPKVCGRVGIAFSNLKKGQRQFRPDNTCWRLEGILTERAASLRLYETL